MAVCGSGDFATAGAWFSVTIIKSAATALDTRTSASLNRSLSTTFSRACCGMALLKRCATIGAMTSAHSDICRMAVNESTVASGDVVSEATAPDGRGT